MVVVDNCNSAPDTQGLADLVPRPHAPGQVVIITTNEPGWLDHASGPGDRVQLAGLALQDLQQLELSSTLANVVNGSPLIGLALAALRDHGGVQLPASSELSGPDLVWDLLRRSAAVGPSEVELARVLAWLPPEPVLQQALAKISTGDASPGDTLQRLRFVTSASTVGAQLDADDEAGDSGSRYRDLYRTRPVGGDAPGLLMHRLFAAAVRHQTWADEPDAAADAIGRLLTTDEGRWLFIAAADASALALLEAGDAERAVRQLAGPGPAGRLAPGLLWHGLGYIRERRGPVRDSAGPFAAAVATLDEASYPFQVAESMIGVARVTYQGGGSPDELGRAQGQIERARELLAPLPERDARQLREQGNALSWLIEQKLTAGEPDLDRKAERYAEVYRNLWLSFAERLRIARGEVDGTPVDPGCRAEAGRRSRPRTRVLQPGRSGHPARQGPS